MIERIIEIILDESKWLPVAMALSLLAIALLAAKGRGQGLSRRVRVLSGLHLFYGCMIGIMTLGHLLAVALKHAQGTLEGSPWFLYPLGLVLTTPAWWLVACAVALERDEERLGQRAVTLNVAMAVGLLAAGPHNLPLAAPAAWNVAYHYHSRRALGWTLVTVASAAYLALFVGSMVFFLSGQSFEELKGLE